MKSLARTRAIGGSLAITIPIEIVRGEMLKENELIELEVRKHKQDFFGAIKDIGPFTVEDELKGQFD